MQRTIGPTCDGCHSVSYDIHTKQVPEWNVGCERCHGPGSEHIAHPSRTNILNPSQMDDAASNDTCIACHSQGRPLAEVIEGKAYDWPVGYRVGLHLADFWVSFCKLYRFIRTFGEARSCVADCGIELVFSLFEGRAVLADRSWRGHTFAV